MENLPTKDVVTALLLLALGMTMVITSFWLFFQERHQILRLLGSFIYVSFALIAGLLGFVAMGHGAARHFDLAALYTALALAFYLLGLGLRRLTAGLG